MTAHQDADALREAVERLHGVAATFDHVAWVEERFGGETAWAGQVHVFRIRGDPGGAEWCYAWTSPTEGSERRRFYAVLGRTPINGPGDAVRASIIRDHRS